MRPSAQQSPLFTGLHATLWMSIAFFWMVLAALILTAFREEALRDLVSLGALSAATFLLTAALLIGRYPGGSKLSSALGFRPTHPLLVPLGLLGGIIAQIPADGILALVHHYFPATQEQTLARMEMMEPQGVGHGVALVVVLAILVPVAEEAFFRGAVYGALRRSGRSGARAALYTGIGFTLSHFDPTTLLPIGFVAAYLGVLRAVSGSLWPSVMAHVGFNGLTMLGAVANYGFSRQILISPSVQISGVVGLSLIVWMILRLGRRSPRAFLSRKEEEKASDD